MTAWLDEVGAGQTSGQRVTQGEGTRAKIRGWGTAGVQGRDEGVSKISKAGRSCTCRGQGRARRPGGVLSKDCAGGGHTEGERGQRWRPA